MGAQELLLLAAVAFVLFGSKRLPELAKAVGSSVVEFKKALREGDGDVAQAAQAPSLPAPHPAVAPADPHEVRASRA